MDLGLAMTTWSKRAHAVPEPNSIRRRCCSPMQPLNPTLKTRQLAQGCTGTLSRPRERNGLAGSPYVFSAGYRERFNTFEDTFAGFSLSLGERAGVRGNSRTYATLALVLDTAALTPNPSPTCAAEA